MTGKTRPTTKARSLNGPSAASDAVLYRCDQSERDLSTAIGEPHFQVSDKATSLEGPAFDRDGNLLFLEIAAGRVHRLSPTAS